MRSLPLLIAAQALLFTAAMAARTGDARSADSLPNRDELQCQDSIAREAREFTKEKFELLVDCNNQVLWGYTCDVAKRDRQIARLMDALTRAIKRSCSDITLEHLGFPGGCLDTNGLSFSVDDLVSCVLNVVATRIDMAIMVEYPNLRPLRNRKEERCQSEIGDAGKTFFRRKLRARLHCLIQQLRGDIPASVDCRAEFPRSVRGDEHVDGGNIGEAIRRATQQLYNRLQRACNHIALEPLGFPGLCPDAALGAKAAGSARLLFVGADARMPDVWAG